jgi:outer membrane lipoprotein-sorting protein
MPKSDKNTIAMSGHPSDHSFRREECGCEYQVRGQFLCQRQSGLLELTLVLFIFLFSQSVFCQTFKPIKDTAAFKQKVQKMSRETKSIESDFTQVKDLSMLSEKVTSKGHFYFQVQNNLRWQYNEPYKYIIVINKDKFLIKDENNKVKKYDMNSNKVFKEINDIMVSCVNGNILGSSKFSITYFENDKGYKMELAPTMKGMKESLKKINMYFDKNVTSVTKLEMVENCNDMTTIDFTNKKINGPIAPENFTLK